ncbi:MAG: hypothetical protein KIT87_07320 [Anaerolineae bacterium]|nr:hypothetical protein [Anaerolineae bacterium]
MPSRDFTDFYFSCFDTSFGAVHNGLDRKALLKLEGDERQEAERLLLNAIETSIDSRPIEAVGVLKLQAASPILKQRLASSIDANYEYNRVHSAWALFQIERYPDAAHIIVDILKHTHLSNQWSRMKAVQALAAFGKNLFVVDILLETLFDQDNFIGFLATRSLKHIFASDKEIMDGLNQIERIQIKIKDPDPRRSDGIKGFLGKLLPLIRSQCFEENRGQTTVSG